jgi:ABC-type Fe3+-hydroxamate transport system substrate-binding protein
VALVAACQSAPAQSEASTLTAPAPAVAAAEVAEAEATDVKTVSAEGVEVASADADVICRSVKVTGSRFAKRECKTADAWRQFDAYTNQNAREATDKIQRVGTGSAANAN